MRSLATVSFILGLSAISAPIYAKESAASSVAGSVMLCDSILIEPEKVIGALKKSGWKDVTPSMFGRSMAAITGSYQLQNGKNMALVSAPGSMVDINCQFDIAKLSKAEKTELATIFTKINGPSSVDAEKTEVWTTANGSVSMMTSSNAKVTILWLPKKEDAE